MQIPKNKPYRISKAKLKELYKQALERDGGRCLITGISVPEGTPSHHIVYHQESGSDILDTVEEFIEKVKSRMGG